MKKIVLITALMCICILSFSQTDSYLKKFRCSIISEEIVRSKLKYPKEAKFNSDVVHETNGYGKAIVLRKFIAKNAYGVQSNYVYKIWLSHNGKDWTERNNWNYSKLIIENSDTGKQQVY